MPFHVEILNNKDYRNGVESFAKYKGKQKICRFKIHLFGPGFPGLTVYISSGGDA
jgi:hypothetical protein